MVSEGSSLSACPMHTDTAISLYYFIFTIAESLTCVPPTSAVAALYILHRLAARCCCFTASLLLLHRLAVVAHHLAVVASPPRCCCPATPLIMLAVLVISSGLVATAVSKYAYDACMVMPRPPLATWEGCKLRKLTLPTRSGEISKLPVF